MQAGDGIFGFARANAPFSGVYGFGINLRCNHCGFHDERGADAGFQGVFSHVNELRGDDADYDQPVNLFDRRLAVWRDRLRQPEPEDIVGNGP